MTFRSTTSPAIIGHRGFGVGKDPSFVENTLPSALAAIEAGANWIEIDVRRTSDDDLILHHDSTIQGARISALPSGAQELHRLTRFEDFLEGVPPTVGLDLEIKPDLIDTQSRLHTADLVIETLRKVNVNNPLIFTSFDTATLNQVRASLPHAPIGFLTWARYPFDLAVVTAASIKADAVCAHVTSVVDQNHSRERIAEIDRALEFCEKLGIELMVWGPTPDQIPALLNKGVDALCVDHVLETAEIIRNRKS